MDLTTTYLGMTLRSPLVSSASPLSEDIGNIKRMEDAGAGAVVFHSLFEEQLHQESLQMDHYLAYGSESYAEALSYFPEPDNFLLGPDAYLEHIRRAKEAVDIPIIASLNGSTLGGWTKYAQKMEQAGADALELNIYYIPTDINMTGSNVELQYLDILQTVKQNVKIPIALKLSPFFSNMANMAHQFAKAGANGLVLFNRFYQPDINLNELTVEPNILLSTPQAMRLPLRWIAILYGQVDLDFAATSGIHQASDVIKMLMVGANVTMMASVLLQRGIDHLRVVEKGMREWMTENEYLSVQQMQGSMSQKHCSAPSAFERAQYMKALQSYQLTV